MNSLFLNKKSRFMTNRLYSTCIFMICRDLFDHTCDSIVKNLRKKVQDGELVYMRNHMIESIRSSMYPASPA